MNKLYLLMNAIGILQGISFMLAPYLREKTKAREFEKLIWYYQNELDIVAKEKT